MMTDGSIGHVQATRASLRSAKSGSLAASKYQKLKLRRDRKIYEDLRKTRLLAMEIAGRPPVMEDELPVIYDHPPYPIERQVDGMAMPMWRDLSKWFKVILFTMLVADLGNTMLAFTIKLPERLEKRWIYRGKNPANMMRDRIRRELDKTLGKGAEFFFVLEGLAKGTQQKVRLHAHGCISYRSGAQRKAIEQALARAAGKGVHGVGYVPRDVSVTQYVDRGDKWTNYTFKYANSIDDRMLGNRVVISRNATQAAKAYWFILTHKS